MKNRDFRLTLPPWLSQADPDGIVMSARIRLARNVEGSAFPGWAGDGEGEQLCKRLVPILKTIPPLSASNVVLMEEADPQQRQLLRERHLISTELAGKGLGSAVLTAPDESLSVMINEEDHLRIQGFAPGRDLDSLWKKVDELDTFIAGVIPYAASVRLGYLTACPSNVGTGLRASLMLHMPGLRLTGDAEKVAKGLSKLGVAVRGLIGEGSEPSGSMFQISNQVTLGAKEDAIILRLKEVADEVCTHESRARLRLAESKPNLLKDRVVRSWALLANARLMSAEEALDLLSGIRLGMALKWIRNLSWEALDQLFLLVQPAHLQRHIGRVVSPDERDEIRAELIRTRMSGVEWI